MFEIRKALQREAATGHSYCSPSQLYRIILCPASLHESTKAPIQPPSAYAEEGTRKHEIVSRLLNGKITHSSLIVETDEVKQEILACLDYVTELQSKKQNSGRKEWIEDSITLRQWGLAEIWGTSDYGIAFDNQIHVVDWKFGSGVTVYAEENEQLMAYAAGCVSPAAGLVASVKDSDIVITLHVVQPPIGHIDLWTLTLADLEKWMNEKLRPALAEAKGPEASYNPGDKQCRFCPAAMTCRARYDLANKQASEVFSLTRDLAVLTKEELAGALEMIQSVQKYASQIITYAQVELSHGRSFPGYKLVSGRSLRTWLDKEATESWISGNSIIPDEKLFKKTLLSPAQAEKLDRHLKKDPAFQLLITKPEGKPQLVKTDDPRPALEPTSVASEVFKDVNKE